LLHQHLCDTAVKLTGSSG